MTALFLATASFWIIAALLVIGTYLDRDMRRIGEDQ